MGGYPGSSDRDSYIYRKKVQGQKIRGLTRRRCPWACRQEPDPKRVQGSRDNAGHRDGWQNRLYAWWAPRHIGKKVKGRSRADRPSKVSSNEPLSTYSPIRCLLTSFPALQLFFIPSSFEFLLLLVYFWLTLLPFSVYCCSFLNFGKLEISVRFFFHKPISFTFHRI